MLETSCQNCIFAEYNGRTQTDCALGMLLAHKNVIESYNENGEFFVINGLCLTYRDNRWDYHNRTLQEQKKQLEKELQLNYTLFVYFGDNHTLQQLEQTLSKIPEIAPKQIIIINNHKDKTLNRQLCAMCEHTNLPWIVDSIVEADIDMYKCFDISYKKAKGVWCALIQCGDSIDNAKLQQINETILPHEQFIAVKNISELFIMKIAHNTFGGNYSKTSTEKLEEYILENPEWDYMIKSL
jgi:hypothetical protein